MNKSEKTVLEILNSNGPLTDMQVDRKFVIQGHGSFALRILSDLANDGLVTKNARMFEISNAGKSALAEAHSDENARQPA